MKIKFFALFLTTILVMPIQAARIINSTSESIFLQECGFYTSEGTYVPFDIDRKVLVPGGEIEVSGIEYFMFHQGAYGLGDMYTVDKLTDSSVVTLIFTSQEDGFFATWEVLQT